MSWCRKKEFLLEVRSLGKSKNLQNLVCEILNLGIKSFFHVSNNVKMRMSDPRRLNLSIHFQCFILSFVSCLVILTWVKLRCSIRCCDHMNDCIISLISANHFWFSNLIKYSLPYFIAAIRFSIHQPSVSEDNSWLLQACISIWHENIFQSYLGSHKVCLEMNCIKICERLSIYWKSTFH